MRCGEYRGKNRSGRKKAVLHIEADVSAKQCNLRTGGLVESVPAIRDSVLAGNTVAEDADCRTCEELLHLAVGIYEKRREARKLKRKLGYTYEKRLHNAEQVLFGELAAVLEIEPESVPEVLFASVR